MAATSDMPAPDRRGALATLSLALAGATAPAWADEFPHALTGFRQRGNQPFFGPAKPGSWDAAIRERGWILKDGEGWRLWYTGYDGTKTGRRMLGLATSRDGLHWNRHPANPIIRDHWVEDVMVVADGSRLLMVAEGERDRAQLFESADGIAWKRHGTLDVRLASGEPIPDGPFGTPVLWKDHDRWCLFYERMDKGVWLATSSDLKLWKNHSDAPVLVPGPAAHDHDMIAMNQIIRHKGRYYASYHGTNTSDPLPRKWCSCLAVSDDLIRWTKLGKPLFPPEENKSSAVFVPHGQGYRLYTMHPAVVLHEPAD
ncbi:MAG: glycosylase [Planctomycetota bacterium]